MQTLKIMKFLKFILSWDFSSFVIICQCLTVQALLCCRRSPFWAVPLSSWSSLSLSSSPPLSLSFSMRERWRSRTLRSSELLPVVYPCVLREIVICESWKILQKGFIYKKFELASSTTENLISVVTDCSNSLVLNLWYTKLHQSC